MRLNDERIAEQNPWWMAVGWERRDPHLRRLSEMPIRLPTPLVDDIDLRSAGIHTIRGPRQVGKSTDLKLLIQRALDEGVGSKRIVYLSFELLEGASTQDFVSSVARAKELAGSGKGAYLLLLDEVTAVDRWQRAIQGLWDRGELDRDIVVCTGSSAVDLAKGTTERLPGRRGAGKDHLVLSQGFSGFARAIDSDIPHSPELTLPDFTTKKGQELLKTTLALCPRLDELLELYLHFGGLPRAVAEASLGWREPSEETRQVVWDAILGETMRRGTSMTALQALFERIVVSLGSTTNWLRIAREMDIPLKRGGRSGSAERRSVQDEVESLARGYLILVLYGWKQRSDTGFVSRDKKIYLADPLLHTVALGRAPGLKTDYSALVENAVGMALYRRYEPRERMFESFGFPSGLHYWNTKGGEIDFICGPRASIDPLEVKYVRRVDRRVLAGMKRALPGRKPVVASRDELEVTDDHAIVPVSQLLWAVG